MPTPHYPHATPVHAQTGRVVVPIALVSASDRAPPDSEAWRDAQRNCLARFFHRKFLLGRVCCDRCGCESVKVYVHILFVLFAAVSAVLGVGSFLLQGATTGEWLESALWLVIFLTVAPICFASLALHELAHATAARYFTGFNPRGRAYAVLIAPTGGVADVHHAGGAWRELVVALAGPLAHAVQAAAWFFSLAAITFWVHVPMRCDSGAQPAANFALRNPCSAMAIAPLFGAAVEPGYGTAWSGFPIKPTLPPSLECLRSPKDLNTACGYSSFFFNLCRYGVLINVGYAFANVLVPMHPLDGGRIAVAALSVFKVPLRVTCILLIGYAALGGVLMTLVGVWLAFFVWPLAGFVGIWMGIWTTVRSALRCVSRVIAYARARMVGRRVHLSHTPHTHTHAHSSLAFLSFLFFFSTISDERVGSLPNAPRRHAAVSSAL